MNTTKYNPHVKSYPNYPNLGLDTPYPSLDTSLGSLLILCSVVGIPGNILGAVFFSTTTEEDSVSLLYTIICCVDTLTSLSHLPVTVALFRFRHPGIFNHHLFCALWEILFTILQKLSMFLVLLLSAFRTVIILNPYYKIRGRKVMTWVFGYLLLLSLLPLLQYLITPLRGEFKYSWDGAYCYYNLRRQFEHVVNIVLAGLSPILSFVALLISVVKLRKSAGKSKTSRWKHRTSVTIVMFTTLFLVCNIPLFINLIHNMASKFFGVEYPGVYFGTRFMFWYSWHIAKVETVVVNAALNPVLYVCRMERFRRWTTCLVTCTSYYEQGGMSRDKSFQRVPGSRASGSTRMRTEVVVKNSKIENE